MADGQEKTTTPQPYEEVYARFGKPLEATRRGEYVAVSAKGETIVGPVLVEVAKEAAARFGPGVYLFKIGDVAVGSWRRSSANWPACHSFDFIRSGA